ncbi:MAG: RluA family pseudouridine synthase [Alphaproteobacteria bacterium]
MSNSHSIIVSPEEAGTRVDKFLSARLDGISRSRIQSLMDGGHISCDGKTISDAATKVKDGQHFDVKIPDVVESHILPQDIPLSIVYEDEHILILNKPAGLTVHPGAGNPDMTLVNALLAHCGTSLSGIGGVARPGIVHRIDKETSGLLAVAKNDAAHAALSEQLATRTLKRTYTALVWGTLKQKQGTITGNIGRSPVNRQKMAVVKTGGRSAVTHYKIVTSYQLPVISLVECNLETGRTHQIRVHFAHIGNALVGDPVYGGGTANRIKTMRIDEAMKTTLLGFERQALHAKELGLIHPATGKHMLFTCEMPEDMRALISALE